MNTCDFMSHEGYGQPRAACPNCTPMLKGRPIGEPGPIRYYEPLADARRLHWKKLTDAGCVVELHKTYIGARYNTEARVWMIGRVHWCDDCGHFEVAQDVDLNQRDHSAAMVDYIAPDLLGTPYTGLKAVPLAQAGALR